ncbi:ROK family protein [Craurococcus roseus]|uniref:ROK family protein n=1 Tax=Craurococcus roseus TaxID=77585 RepID=A0ABN1ENK8_9PROT
MSNALGGQGSNSAVVRHFNERVILSALRRLGEASKADLARQVNLTSNTAGQIVRDLERQKLVRASGKRAGLRGQPATLLRLDPGGAYGIGVKLGRRTLDSTLVDFAGRVLKARRQERDLPPPETALRLVGDAVAALRRAVPRTARDRIAGVGFAVPYNLGSWRRELDLPADVSAAWTGFDLGAGLRAALGLPVLVENDGTAVAVAELFQGHGRELDDFAVVYVGAAVGGGVVLGGAPRRGVTGNAGDVGLMPVPPSRLATAPRPSRGSDILLNRASVNALVRHLRRNGVPVATNLDLERAIPAQPELVGEWLEDCADALVNPLLSISSLLDLQAIVVDGNLPRSLVERLVERLRVLLAANAPEARRPPTLLLGTAGRDAAAIGAALLPLHSSYGPHREALFGH